MARSCIPGADIAYLPQQSELDRSFPARVVDLVSLGLWPRRLLGRFRPEDRDAVTKALSAVGLEGFEKRPIDTLSGRPVAARAVCARARAGRRTDPARRAVQRHRRPLRRRPRRLIKRWHGENRTVMVVVHDLDLVRAHFPRRCCSHAELSPGVEPLRR